MSYDVPPGPPPDLNVVTPVDNLLILLGLAALLAIAVIAVMRRMRKGGDDGPAGN